MKKILILLCIILLSNISVVFAADGHSNEKIVNLTKYISTHPNDAKAYYERGLAYFFDHQNDLAIADYNKAIEINPNNPNFYYFRGTTYEMNKQNDLAIADFTKVTEMDSNYYNAFYGQGRVYENLKLYTEALNAYKKYVALVPSSEAPMLVDFAKERIDALSKNNKQQENNK